MEVSAKTVDDAIQIALEQLGVSENQVEVVVLQKGKSGILGVGAEEARIKVKLLTQPQKKDEVAKEASKIVETLVKLMGIKAEVSVAKVSTVEIPVALSIEGDDLGVLIGRRGQTLAALQYIVRIIAAERLRVWMPINIDVAGYKKRRYESLQSLAIRLADQVKTSRRPITLEPMPADERRIIHLTLVGHPEVATQSIGEGETRKVAILLKKH